MHKIPNPIRFSTAREAEPRAAANLNNVMKTDDVGVVGST